MSEITQEDAAPTTIEAWVELLLWFISEDERIANAAPGSEWFGYTKADIAGPAIYDDQWVIANAVWYDHNEKLSNRPEATGPGYIDPDATSAHIALWDPKRVLVECEVKREMVALLKAQVDLGQSLPHSPSAVRHARYLLERVGQPYGMLPLPPS